MIDFADINAKVLIAFSLTVIAATLVYIAFKLSELSERKSRKNPSIPHNIKK